MKEAQFINLSLHFLEQVIVCLNQRARGDKTHIPYRNSMMTMVLRDSLGGNCKTRMIATMSPNPGDFFESISTCKFAMRVSLIKNDAIINEIEDPVLIIQKQKREIDDLKNELALVKGKDQKIALDKDDFDFCRKLVKEYLNDDNPESRISLKDMILIQECFKQIKSLYKDLEARVNNQKIEMMVSDSDPNNMKSVKDPEKRIDKELMNINDSLNSELKKCRDLIKQRDDEIKMLLDYIEKLKSSKQEEYLPKNKLLNIIEEEDKIINDIKNNSLGKEVKFENTLSSYTPKNQSTIRESKELNSDSNNSSRVETRQNEQKKHVIPEDLIKELNYANSLVIKEIKPTEELFGSDEARNKAYLLFKTITIHSKSIEENQRLLKANFDLGKKLCEEVKIHREDINKLKVQIENLRKDQIIQEITSKADSQFKLQEDALKEKISKLKDEVQNKSKKITSVFEEKNNIGAMLDNLIRSKVQKEFEIWYNAMRKLFEFLRNYNSKRNDESNQSLSNNLVGNKYIQQNVNTINNDALNSSTSSNKKQRTEDIMKNVRKFNIR